MEFIFYFLGTVSVLSGLFISIADGRSIDQVAQRLQRVGQNMTKRETTVHVMSEDVRRDDSFNKVKFPNELEYEIDIDGNIMKLKLGRNKEVRTNIPYEVVDKDGIHTETSERMKRTAYYTNEEYSVSVACTACDDGEGNLKCDLKAIFPFDDEDCYYTGHGVSECGKIQGYSKLRNDVIDARAGARNNGSTGGTRGTPGNTNRKKRQFDSTSYYVEMYFIVDEWFMYFFSERNAVGFEDDVLEYLGLLTNAMNVIYTSLQEVTNGNLKIGVHYAGARLPMGTNPDWSQLFFESPYYILFNGVLDYLFDQDVMNNPDYVPQDRSVDVAMFITGLELAEFVRGQLDSGVIGVAYLASVCDPALSVTLTEMNGFTTNTISHELGHHLGAPHDNFNGWLMDAVLVRPDESTKNTFNKFSSASANSISLTVGSLSPNCLESTQISAEEFNENFCKGYLGSHYDLDDQCIQTLFNPDAFACTAGIPLDERCYRSIPCGVPDAQSCSSKYQIFAHNFAGCGDGKVCYENMCVDTPIVCEMISPSTTTTESSTSTTTTESTSTTTESTTSTTTTESTTSSTTTESSTSTTSDTSTSSTTAQTSTTTTEPTTTSSPIVCIFFFFCFPIIPQPTNTPSSTTMSSTQTPMTSPSTTPSTSTTTSTTTPSTTTTTSTSTTTQTLTSTTTSQCTFSDYFSCFFGTCDSDCSSFGGVFGK